MRFINLLKNVQADVGDKLAVLGISMEKNAIDLMRLLDAGAEVFYAVNDNPILTHFPTK